MRNTLLAAIAATLLLPAGSCCRDNKSCVKAGDRDETFTGVLPAADVAGIRYTLNLDYDDDHGNNKGEYDLVESYLIANATVVGGYRDSVSFKSKGDFRVETGKGKQSGIRYLRLVPDRKYRNAETLYLIVSSDTTLTLTNDRLESFNTPGLNYTLRLVK